MRKPKQLTRPMAQAHYRTARFDLLLVIILTVVNIVTLFLGSESMMLFSVAVPYYAVAVAWYHGPQWFLHGSLILAGVILVMYLLCWIFSKKHYGWVIGAAALFFVDTLALIVLYWGIWDSGIMDFLFHGAVLFYLIRGAHSASRIKHLPEETPAPVPMPVENTPPIRRAEDGQEGSVLAQAQTQIGFISYRRVDRINELVINGYVYDEVELLVETPHELRAIYDGHFVQSGLIAGSGVRYIYVDGQQIVCDL